ncbi:hypothetical protein [Caldalkalibacillus thermarum]|uniref:hypothetical protein n=1 Tax=Caldalkalibacillus thermarum TaxID=296745 RepID=UPI000307C467|nr:hypothetical protein [Caldalkalibacillus thermarum]
MVYIFVCIALISFVLAFKYKKPFILATPFVLFALYFLWQVAMVPLGFMETMRFIFSLR